MTQLIINNYIAPAFPLFDFWTDPDDTTSDGTNIGKAHMFAMVGHSECSEKYPALAELLENLEALPYELNKKGKYSKRRSVHRVMEAL